MMQIYKLQKHLSSKKRHIVITFWGLFFVFLLLLFNSPRFSMKVQTELVGTPKVKGQLNNLTFAYVKGDCNARMHGEHM